jgi:hypothetical protein
MTEQNSFLVPYSLGAVPPGCDPYPAGAPWAEPDVEAAAVLMRLVIDQPQLAARKGAQASADVGRSHGLPAASAFVRQRLEAQEAAIIQRRFEELTALRAPDGSRRSPSKPAPIPFTRRLVGGAKRRVVQTARHAGRPSPVDDTDGAAATTR